jgi:hypothetical protein
MAGMFYSLQEVAEKLNKTEEEVKEIVKEGKLREFRDGPNLLFKVDEVEALMSDTSVIGPKEPSTKPEQPEEAKEEEISLVPESAESSAGESELSAADTTAASEETSILEGTKKDYRTTEDILEETKVGSSEISMDSSSKASLEEIEEDVNLDTFGSGSGLLDLSLQADDTSLGGILDEIYTPEGEKAEDKEAGEPSSAVGVAAEAESALSELPEEDFAGPEPAPEAAAMAPRYIESEPDTVSNALGIMLFLPLLALVYMAIVAVAGQKGVMPSILQEIQGLIWYITIAAVVVAILIVGASFMLAGKSGKPAKKKAQAAPPPVPEDETT